MSLSYIDIKCSDGKTYRDPCWRAPGYFLCYDDNDPPELVMLKPRALTPEKALSMAREALEQLGLHANIIVGSYSGESHRFMPEDVTKKRVTSAHDFKKCFRFFLEVLELPPPPNLHSGVV